MDDAEMRSFSIKPNIYCKCKIFWSFHTYLLQPNSTRTIMLLDGNHRFEAMIKIREWLLTSRQDTDDDIDLPFKTVGCRVLEEGTSTEEALAIATSRKIAEGDRLQMTDYEIAYVIRKVLNKLQDKHKEAQYNEIYRALRAGNVSCLNLFTAHITWHYMVLWLFIHLSPSKYCDVFNITQYALWI